MRIITSGSRYLDIDGYGGIVAYAELLTKQGIEALAVSTAPFNESITKTVRSWPVTFETSYSLNSDDTFTLIDVSAPEYFDVFVDADRIDTVIDHHPGREVYWQEQIGSGANIELVGAACTQVYEYWKRAGLIDQISSASARLLMCGILDNTLNFGAQITTQRDKDAYDDLKQYADLPENWPEVYFGEIQSSIDSDPVTAIKNDTKDIDEFPSRPEPLRVGQFALWSATDIIANYQLALEDAYNIERTEWFINIISIGERRSYFICKDPATQKWVADLLGVTFNGNLATADRLWLRKEIIEQDIRRSTS
jgi:inorganic pyrophosphatase/exopolyphosphatase